MEEEEHGFAGETISRLCLWFSRYINVTSPLSSNVQNTLTLSHLSVRAQKPLMCNLVAKILS
jgi:hypothetical protein